MYGFIQARRFAAAFLVSALFGATAHAEQVVAETVAAVGAESAPRTPAEPLASAGPNILAAPFAAASHEPASLTALVVAYEGVPDGESACLAKAVYFEARGESLEGQLAVAEVVLNRVASGVYPSNICDVITQKSQFSFIRRGRFPAVNENSASWRTAAAIAHIARNGLAQAVASNVLWYHANYVSPSWGRSLTKVARIGVHIFYI